MTVRQSVPYKAAASVCARERDFPRAHNRERFVHSGLDTIFVPVHKDLSPFGQSLFAVGNARLDDARRAWGCALQITKRPVMTKRPRPKQLFLDTPVAAHL